jgi:hypothetical protein
MLALGQRVNRFRPRAIAIADRHDNQASVSHRVMILFVLALLASMMATHAQAAPALGNGGMHGGGGFHGHFTSNGFRAPMIGTVPQAQPTFNPSVPYTVPQAPEIPVSPANPGSIFGNG